MSYHPLTFLCAILLLSACGKSENQPAPKLFKEQIDTLNKAKDVDATLQQQTEAQRKMVEQQAQ